MPKIEYVPRNFSRSSLNIIKVANSIIHEYMAQGFRLTLRQLYYQFVSRDLVANTMKSYKLIGSVINDARLAGHIDWRAIEDRTRELRGNTRWESTSSILKAASETYKIDRWKGQKVRPEVWIEKDALLGVFERICNALDVDFFSCRGYTSQSEMWEAAQRIGDRYNETNQGTIILHFGDHDPSGMDMSRDIENRLGTFIGTDAGIEPDDDLAVGDILTFRRVALHKAQIDKLKLPPNPAKMTDSRAMNYVEQYGRSSWELDALDPKFISALVESNVISCVKNKEAWKDQAKAETEGRKYILKVAEKGKR